jgi:hypothetical protein
MEHESIFWMTSTLAQSISAVYGLYLVYYVFAMNGLRSEAERTDKKEEFYMKSHDLAWRHAHMLLTTIWRIHIAESRKRLATALFGVSLLFLAVIEIDLLILSAPQPEPLADFALWTTLAFLIAITGGFSYTGLKWRKHYIDETAKFVETGKFHKSKASPERLEQIDFKEDDLAMFD